MINQLVMYLLFVVCVILLFLRIYKIPLSFQYFLLAKNEKFFKKFNKSPTYSHFPQRLLYFPSFALDIQIPSPSENKRMEKKLLGTKSSRRKRSNKEKGGAMKVIGNIYSLFL